MSSIEHGTDGTMNTIQMKANSGFFTPIKNPEIEIVKKIAF